MADTKKEHYVPRCYLENFASGSKRIEVFDKWKLMVRNNQDIMNVAMENGFYDIDLLGILSHIGTERCEMTKRDIMSYMNTDCWDDIVGLIGDKRYVEKEHLSNLEGVYSQLLKAIIQKSYNGNNWVLHNCRAMSENDKVLLSFFIAIQFLRTPKFRNTLTDMVTGMAQTLTYKSQIGKENSLPKEAFEVDANPEYIKLQHSAMILDPEVALHIAETLVDHIWVMCVNKTSVPFFTSDDPVVRIPHKQDGFHIYSGFASEEIEIAFPISSSLLLCMYDKNAYGHLFCDRQFYEMKNTEEINYYNMFQVIDSYRCIFAVRDHFATAKKYCEDHPELQAYRSTVEVS